MDQPADMKQVRSRRCFASDIGDIAVKIICLDEDTLEDSKPSRAIALMVMYPPYGLLLCVPHCL